MQMDRKNLRKAYNSVVFALGSNLRDRLFDLYRKEINPSSYNWNSEIEVLYEKKYLGVIDPLVRYIAKLGIEKDYIYYELKANGKYFRKEEEGFHRVLDVDYNFSISEEVRDSLFNLIAEVQDIIHEEVEIIEDSIKPKNKKKPTRDTQLILNQLQICGLFKTLQDLKIINQTSNTQLCNPLGEMLNSEPEQVRQSLSKKLEQIDKDKIVAQLIKAIEHVDEKLVNKVSIQK